MPKPRGQEHGVRAGGWTDTELWALLKKRRDAASSTRRFLENCLDDVERVLAKGGTSPADFTLHDEDHSFRVAQRMMPIMSAKLPPHLSSPELGLLLLSAYLHDIGMTPSRGKVRAYHTFLMTGSAASLSDAARRELQQWLDEEGREVEPPIAKGAPTEDDLRLADELVAYFARHKHNDWSKEYIEENLAGRTWDGYETWMEDLVDLCQSHHWGYSRLADDSFNPKVLPSGDVVHLRYLACVLRIADILENDPERTPALIYRHRQIAARSQIYWQKDHGIRTEIGKNRSITVRATPKQAVFHRAIVQTAAAIETELRLCDRLNAELPFDHLPKHDPLPHTWDLKESVFTDIQPYKDSYEYIEGAFRPDTQRVLQMLAGIELYGNPLAAVRELLQNAFDAVRESVARERLALPDASQPADPKWAIELGNRHEVSLTFEVDDHGRGWLVCRDDGIGMTKEIIENYLLVSGSSRRSDVVSLERLCEQKGFSSERTGRFGIGVLSYFMIADQVRIRTRRSQIAGDADRQAWIFTSNGVGDFGELSRLQAGAAGTEVALRLKRDLATQLYAPVDVRYHISQYVAAEITWTPCRLSVDLSYLEPTHRGAGWGRRVALDIPEEAASQTDVVREEGVLPGSLGRFRTSLHYFQLQGGPSLGFCRERVDDGTLRILNVDSHGFRVPSSKALFSYKGMRLGDEKLVAADRITLPANCTIQIDWTTERAGDISVDRTKFRLSASARSALASLCERLSSSWKRILGDAAATKYELLNIVVGRIYEAAPASFNWTKFLPDGTSCWCPVEWPAILLDDDQLTATLVGQTTTAQLFDIIREDIIDDALEQVVMPLVRLEWEGQALALLRPVKGAGREGFWNLHAFPPDRLLVARTPLQGVSVIPLWLKPPVRNALPFAPCDFPASWTKFVTVRRDDTTFVNRGHPLSMWPTRFVSDSGSADILIGIMRGADITSFGVSQWNGLDPETRRATLMKLWQSAAPDVEPSDVAVLLYYGDNKSAVIELVAETGEARRVEGDLTRALPDSGASWLHIPSLDVSMIREKARALAGGAG